jgi:hypothetical protein
LHSPRVSPASHSRHGTAFLYWWQNLAPLFFAVTANATHPCCAPLASVPARHSASHAASVSFEVSFELFEAAPTQV